MEADLRLGKFSESCNQGVVIFSVCRLYGHVNDVDWVLPLILEGMGAKSAAARKRKTKAFSFTTALTLKLSSSYRLEDSEYGAVSKSGSAKLERTSSKFLQKTKRKTSAGSDFVHISVSE